MMEYGIDAGDVIGKDPLGRVLASFRLSPLQAAIASLSFFLIYVIGLSALFGVLLPDGELEKSALGDWVNLVGFFAIHPAVMFVYVWQTGAIASLYHLVIPLSPGPMQAGLLRASRIFHKTFRTWAPGFVFGGVVVGLGVAYIIENFGALWYSANWVMGGILQFSRFLLFYMITSIVTRHLIAAFNLNRIYNHIKLPVLVGQTKYGKSFDAITRYGLGFAGFGAALGLFIGIRYLFSVPVFPEDAIYLTAYIVLIPLSFSLPFWQAHANMRNAKTEAVNRIQDSLQDEYDRLMKDVPDISNLETSSERMGMLRTLLELTEKAPTWPFENWAIYRVFAATILPFVMTGLGFFIDLAF